MPFRHTIWVATPPPNFGRYTNYGGRFALNFGVMWVRVDRQVTSFIGGALGIVPKPRTGWSTAGALPTDYALETFCRNNIAPESGVCVNSAGLTIDGQGGIQLIRGDIGSNESLNVTANTGGGVVLNAGNVFLVNRTCASSTWNCPNSPPQGGISDGTNGKNAFYIAPIPVPHFASPVDAVTDHTYNCANATALCIPYQDQASSSPSSPGDWTCSTSSSSPARCGNPTVTTVNGDSTVSCVGAGGGIAGNHYYPIGPSLGNGINTDSAHNQNNGNKYQNIDDVTGTSDTAAVTPTAVDYLYTDNISTSPGSTSFIVNLGASGPRLSGQSTVRYNVFKTNANTGVADPGGNNVTVTVSLLGSGATPIATDVARTLTGTPTQYSFVIGANVIPAAQFNSLRLQFVFNTTGASSPSTILRGGAVAWAEIEHPDPQPATPPMIPPGYYQSITLPDGTCAVLDPTGEYTSTPSGGLYDGQLPGIYEFGGTGSANNQKIKIGSGSYLIGDGVTLVFDSGWPDSGSNRGIAVGTGGAFVLNTMKRTDNTAPCTPSNADSVAVNMSAPLSTLPYSAVCTAWLIDPSSNVGIRPGQTAWNACNTSSPDSASHCTERSSYNPHSGWRGITFYFTPDPSWATAHASMNIRGRFDLQGASGNDAGIAFRGVLYAPYDDVKMSGTNGFRTVGQVLAWTAKFNGGGAYIRLDYPYDFTPAKPYLLEPTIAH